MDLVPVILNVVDLLNQLIVDLVDIADLMDLDAMDLADVDLQNLNLVTIILNAVDLTNVGLVGLTNMIHLLQAHINDGYIHKIRSTRCTLARSTTTRTLRPTVNRSTMPDPGSQ